MELENVLYGIYYDQSNPNSYSTAQKLYKAAKEHLNKLTFKQVKDWLSAQFTYTLHRPVRRVFTRNPIIVECVDQQWEADLVEMQEYKRVNNGYRYILTVIDVMSKYSWAEPMKNKTGIEMVRVFKHIINNGRKPFYLRTDQGKEFLNKDFKALLKENNIHHFTSKNKDIKCAIVERFNRTLKGRMFKYFTAKGTRVWYNVLDDLLIAYNNSKHRTIKMTPVEALETDNSELFKNLYGFKTLEDLYKVTNKPKLNINDTVRRKYERGPFDKSFFPNWTDQIFTITDKSDQLKKPVYKVQNQEKEIQKQRYYPEEIQKVSENLYRIEKIIRRRTRNGIKECLIKWLNYPHNYNSWVKETEIHKL
jgi:hypothetical protein